MYKIKYYDKNNEQKYSDLILTEDDVNEIDKIKNYFYQIMLSIDYYNIVNGNLKELMDTIKTMPLNDIKYFAKINRYFVNMSNSFYMYKNFYKYKFKGEYYNHFNEAKDKYDDYVLMTDLRNYSVHNNLAITIVKYNVLTNENNILISPKEILGDKENISSKGKRILKKLIDEEKDIDVKYLTGSFLSIFNEIKTNIICEQKNKIFEYLDIFEKYLIGKGMNKCESYIVDEKDNIIFCTSNIFYSFFEKFEKEFNFDFNVEEYLKSYYNL